MDDRKEIAKSKLEEYLQSKGIDTRKPFTCLNPAHPDKHPSMSYKDNRCKCFSCPASYDIFDVIGIEYGITDKAEQFKKTYSILGLDNPNATRKKQNNEPRKEEPKTEKDFTALYKEARANISKTDYWKKRGLSEATVKKYGIGYIENWKHPTVSNSAPETPRLIIPITNYNYVARDTREAIPDYAEGYKKMKAKLIDKPEWTFNSKALENSTKPVFITEGEMDALSVIEAGGEAVSIGSVGESKSFLKLVEIKRPKAPLILALDNDAPGKKATFEIEEGLKELGDISFYRFDIVGKYKDPNEALVKDRNTFLNRVQNAIYAVENEAKEEYKKESTQFQIQGFLRYIEDRKNRSAIKTGFNNLDGILGGGIYPGLYFIGAMSSLGKTTFALQIADNVAQFEKRDVLIFSLEMARYELMAKSISRITFLEASAESINLSNAKTTRGILDGSGYGKYNSVEERLIYDSVNEYGKFADKIYIHEGMGDIGVNMIRDVVANHISITGEKPLVIIDYIQLLAPYNERYSDKQNVDKNVLELKRISRDYDVPVIGISSMNRESYKSTSANKGEVSMADFKESGAIEYSADVLIGLQFAKAGEEGYSEKAEKGQDARDIKLVVLKNRNGKPWVEADFMFYSKFNCFEEV